MRKLILICLFLSIGLSAYNYKSTIVVQGSSLTTVALAPKPVNSAGGDSLNMAFGMANGYARITYTQGTPTVYQYKAAENGPIIAIDWNDAGICTASLNEVKVVDPTTLVTKIQLKFPFAGILAMACGYRSAQQPSKIVTAIAFANRIEIYQDFTLSMNGTLALPFRSMTMDLTGKYLYYFQGSNRYVIDMWNKRIFSQSKTNNFNNAVTACKKSGYLDITVSGDEFGLNIWDDYYLLSSYTTTNYQSFVQFTGESDYLVSYQFNTNKINLWRTDFSDYTRWSLSQNFQSKSSSPVLALDAQDNKIVYLADNSIFVYENQGGSASILIVIIVCSVFGFIICVAVIVFMVKRRRNQMNNGGYNNLDDQGFNNNTNNTKNTNNWNNGQNNGGWSNQGQNNGGWSNQGQNNGGWSNQNQGFNSNKNQGFGNSQGNNPYANN